MSSRSASFRSALSRGLVLSIAVVLVGAVVGGVFGWYRERVTQAQAVILLNPLDGNPFSTSGRGDSLTNLETEAQLVRSFDVAELVRTATGTTMSAPDLLTNLEVIPPTNTQLLEISYSDVDPARAVEIAQAFADQFLAFRQANAQSLVDGQITLINQQIADRKSEQDQLSRELAKAPTSGQASVLQTQLDAVTTQINQLRARSAELQIGPFNPGQVVTPAKIHREGILDSWYAYAAIGALIGAVVALMIAFVRSRLDSRIHHADDVLLVGRQILGQVPQQDAATVQGDLSVAGSVTVAPSFRDLRVAVLTKERRRPTVLMLASASADPNQVPLSASGLAVAMATANLRTVVVDTTASWPFREGVGTDRMSLADLLVRDEDLGPALLDVSENLRVVSAVHGGDGSELFLSPAMGRLLERIRRVSDIVVVVAGGIGHSSSLALADKADVLITEVVKGYSHVTDATLPENLYEKDLGVVLITDAGEDTGDSPRRRHRRRPRRKTRVVIPGSPAHAAASDDADLTPADNLGEEGIDEAPAEPVDSAHAAEPAATLVADEGELNSGDARPDKLGVPRPADQVPSKPTTIPKPVSSTRKRSRRRRPRPPESPSDLLEPPRPEPDAQSEDMEDVVQTTPRA